MMELQYYDENDNPRYGYDVVVQRIVSATNPQMNERTDSRKELLHPACRCG